MQLALVPTKLVQLGPTVERIPDLPESVLQRPGAWGQAGSHPGFRSRNVQLVRLLVTDAELDAIASTAGVVILGSAGPAAETERLLEALRTEQAPEAGEPWPARDEFVAAYRSLAKASEVDEARRAALAALGRIVTVWGLPLLIAALLRGWCPGWLESAGGVSWALVLLHADNFNRANGTLNGATMSDGIGAWTDDGLSGSVVSNEVSSSGMGVCYDSVMDAVGVQRVSVKTRGNYTNAISGGIIARCDPAANTGYLMLNGYFGNSRCYRMDDYTTWSASQLVSGAFNPSDGDTIAVDCNGSTIDFLHNGSSIFGPATDSTYATGKAGLAGYWAGYCDDWQVEIADATSLKSKDGLVRASIKSINGLAIASIKSVDGLA